jgi:hypothetical protein
MSLDYNGMLKELDQTVRGYWDKACKEIGVPPDSKFVTVEALEKSQYFVPFSNGAGILIRAMSEYRFFRYIQNHTLDEMNNYLLQIRRELNKEQHV